eukprot:gene1540-2970_t
METPNSYTAMMAPNCTNNPIVLETCGEYGEGNYYFMIDDGSTSEKSQNSWEIMWSITIDKTRLTYTGGIKTAMVLNYDAISKGWSVLYSQSLLKNKLELTECGVANNIIKSGQCPETSKSTQDLAFEAKIQQMYAEGRFRSTFLSNPKSGKSSSKYDHRHRYSHSYSNAQNELSVPDRLIGHEDQKPSRNLVWNENKVNKEEMPIYKSYILPSSKNDRKKDSQSKPTSHPVQKPVTTSNKETVRSNKQPSSSSPSSTLTSIKKTIETIKSVLHKNLPTSEPTKYPSTLNNESSTLLDLTINKKSKPDLKARSTVVQMASKARNNSRTSIQKLIHEKSTEILKDIKSESSGKSSAELKVIMYDSDGEGWFNANYEGTMFYITDETKTDLLAYGTLANGSYSAFCDYCLEEGSYYFRVTPSIHNIERKWSFCHTDGTTSQELSFHIENGICIPDALVDLKSICSRAHYSVITVAGVLSLQGVTSEIFTQEEKWVVVNALGSSVYGWDPGFIEINDVFLNLHGDMGTTSTSTARSLSSFTYDIEFETSYVSEIAYNIDGTNYMANIRFIESLEKVIQNSISSGDFIPLLTDLAYAGSTDGLKYVQDAELLYLDLKDISFVGTSPLTMNSNDDNDNNQNENGDMYEMVEIVEASFYTSIDFFVLIFVGFFALIGVTAKFLTDRERDQKGVQKINKKVRSKFIEVHQQEQFQQDDLFDYFTLLHPVTKKVVL